MVYDISSGEAVLTEFGYENVYTIQGEEVTQKSKLGQSKLIPVGMNEYYCNVIMIFIPLKRIQK